MSPTKTILLISLIIVMSCAATAAFGQDSNLLGKAEDGSLAFYQFAPDRLRPVEFIRKNEDTLAATQAAFHSEAKYGLVYQEINYMPVYDGTWIAIGVDLNDAEYQIDGLGALSISGRFDGQDRVFLDQGVMFAEDEEQNQVHISGRGRRLSLVEGLIVGPCVLRPDLNRVVSQANHNKRLLPLFVLLPCRTVESITSVQLTDGFHRTK